MALMAMARNNAGGRHSTITSQSAGQFRGRAHGDAGADLRQRPAGLFRVADRDGGEREARYAGDEPPRDVEPDRAEAGQPDAQRLAAR